MSEPRSDTKTIISALRTLAQDIQSGDGVANACCAEAADRLEEYHRALMEIVAKFVNSKDARDEFESGVYEGVLSCAAIANNAIDGK